VFSLYFTKGGFPIAPLNPFGLYLLEEGLLIGEKCGGFLIAPLNPFGLYLLEEGLPIGEKCEGFPIALALLRLEFFWRD